ncbi:hypothetical protein H0Z60_10515 [Ectothiorhodospiraceae bacterium WFHF3C12]|nr:hypothetical protein [Ectothiorhodospiraceae bacterium WFHF3C12]
MSDSEASKNKKKDPANLLASSIFAVPLWLFILYLTPPSLRPYWITAWVVVAFFIAVYSDAGKAKWELLDGIPQDDPHRLGKALRIFVLIYLPVSGGVFALARAVIF